ncbi:competence protein ComJ [Pseudomonas sp. B22129]|uniref:competence protein ComJ n=1 Tax=Pseudomonas sp. B22129 TaxID=3235111 RepID=UPI00378531A8
MAKFEESIYLSYSQLCVFLSSLDEPYNDWSDQSFRQGFSWRIGSVSFRALVDEGDHKMNLFVNEEVSELSADVVRAFKVPFAVKEKNIEIGSVSDVIPLEIPDGDYTLQVEFISPPSNGVHEINIRLNRGVCGFEVLKADGEVSDDNCFDVGALPAT